MTRWNLLARGSVSAGSHVSQWGWVMIDAANYVATETLRDGRTVEIRAQRSEDRERMHAAIARFSSGSLHRRFFGVRRQFSEKETDYFLDIDFVNHVALVVVAGDPSQNGGGRSAAGCLEQDLAIGKRSSATINVSRRFSCAPRRGRRRHSYRGAGSRAISQIIIPRRPPHECLGNRSSCPS